MEHGHPVAWTRCNWRGWLDEAGISGQCSALRQHSSKFVSTWPFEVAPRFLPSFHTIRRKRTSRKPFSDCGLTLSRNNIPITLDPSSRLCVNHNGDQTQPTAAQQPLPQGLAAPSSRPLWPARPQISKTGCSSVKGCRRRSQTCRQTQTRCPMPDAQIQPSRQSW